MTIIKGTWWTLNANFNPHSPVKHTVVFDGGFNGSKSYPNWTGHFIGKVTQNADDSCCITIQVNDYDVRRGASNQGEIVQPRIVASIGNSADNAPVKGFLLVEITYAGKKFNKWIEVTRGVPGSGQLELKACTPVQSAILCKQIDYPNNHILLQIGHKNGKWVDSGLTRRDFPLVKKPSKSIVELTEERKKKLRYAQVNIGCSFFIFSRIGPPGTCGGKKTMAHCFVPGVTKPMIDLAADTTFEHDNHGRVRLRAGRYMVYENVAGATSAISSQKFDFRTWKSVEMGGTYKRATSAIGTADSMKISKKSKMQTNAFKRI